MITTIQFEALKGRSGTYNLKPLTVISGRNFAGKTTITTAVALACLGHLPSLGKTNKATFQLSSATKMSVAADFADGSRITRTWKQSGKSVSESREGEAPDLSPVLDPGQFINASAADRISILARLSTPDGSNRKDPATAALQQILGPFTGNIFDAADLAAEKAELEAKEAGAKKKQWAQTMAGLVELINSAGIPARPERKAQAELEAAIAYHARAVMDHSRLDELSAEAWDAVDELNEIKATGADALPSYTAAAAAAAEAMDQLNKASQYRVNAKSELDAIVAKQKELHDTASKSTRSADELRETIIALNAIPNDGLQANLDALTVEANNLSRDLTSLERDNLKLGNERIRLENELADLNKLERCPFCKSCGAGWKEGVQMSIHEKLEEVSASITRNEEKAKSTKRDLEITEAEKASAARKLTNAREIPELIKILEAKEELPKVQARHNDAIHELDAARKAEAAAIEAHAKAKATLDAVIKYSGNQKRITQLEQIIAKAPTRETVDFANEAVTKAAARLAEATQAVENERQAALAYDEALQREKDRTEAEAQMKEAEKEQAAAAARAKSIREAMKEAMGALFGPILKVAVPLSLSVMGSPLALSPAGEIGIQAPASFIPFEALSGTEQLIATIALQAGLSAQLGGIVIVDEFSRIDADNKAKLIAELAGMINAGTIRQVLIVDHDPKTADVVQKSGGEVITLANA